MDLILVLSDGMHVPAAALVGVSQFRTVGVRRWAGDRHRGIPREPPLCDPFVMVGMLEVLPRECSMSTHPLETSLVAMIL